MIAGGSSPGSPFVEQENVYGESYEDVPPRSRPRAHAQDPRGASGALSGRWAAAYDRVVPSGQWPLNGRAIMRSVGARGGHARAADGRCTYEGLGPRSRRCSGFSIGTGWAPAFSSPWARIEAAVPSCRRYGRAFWPDRRTGAARFYGWRTILSGTLLPARRMADLAGVMRAIVAAGHEMAVHGYDHRGWQDRLYRMSEPAIRRRMTQAWRTTGGDRPSA